MKGDRALPGPLDVACPICEAQPEQECTGDQLSPEGIHYARIERALHERERARE